MNAAFGNGSSSHWSATESGGGSGGGDAGGFGGERGGDDCFPYVSFTVTLKIKILENKKFSKYMQ